MSRTLLSPLRKRKPDAILLDIIKRVVDESSPAEFDGRLDDLWSLVTDRLKEEQRKDQEEAREGSQRQMAGNRLDGFKWNVGVS